MQLPKTRRGILVCTALIVLSAAVVWSATTVTVTKTESRSANAYYYDVGVSYTSVSIQETDAGCYLQYSTYDYATYTQEYGYGYIDCDDVTWSSSGVALDTNTEAIAIMGDGGDIELEWELAPGGGTSTAYKMTSKTELMTTKRFSKTVSSAAVASGTVLGDAFSGTGAMTVNSGKVILQVK